MGKFHPFEDVSEKEIEIQNNTIKINGNLLIGCFIQNYLGRNSGFSNDQKKKVLLHFLNNDDLIDRIVLGNSMREYRIILNPLFKPILINHDPSRTESFTISFNFGSLKNLQGHALKHCIHDHWAQSHHHPLIIDEDDTFFNNFWKEFRTIKCEFLSKYEISDLDTPEKARTIFDPARHQNLDGKIKGIKEGIKLKDFSALNQLLKNFDKKSLCMECIKKHKNVDTFLNCWKLTSKFGIHKIYIKKIREWVVETIQDKNNCHIYSGEKKGGDPKRLHVHTIEKGYDCLHSYALQPSGSTTDIFTLIFKSYQKGKNYYQISTAYPFKRTVKPISEIKRRHKRKKLNIIQYCYDKNWK